MNHIVNLDNGTLAKQIQEAQLENDSPGLTKEVQAYMEELNLPNCLLTRIPQMKWKTLVKKAVSQANEKEIKEEIIPYKKMKNVNVEEENFECKDYLSNLPLYKSRTLFKHKYSMTENVKMNYKNDKSFAKSLWKCKECQNQDSESHLLWCPGYEDLRDGLDLKENSDLCVYLQKVFILRSKEEN